MGESDGAGGGTPFNFDLDIEGGVRAYFYKLLVWL